MENIREQAIAKRDEALQLWEQGQREEALRTLEQAIILVRQSQDFQMQSAMLQHLGNLYKDSGRLQEAIQCYQQSRHLIRSIDEGPKGYGISVSEAAREISPQIEEPDPTEAQDDQRIPFLTRDLEQARQNSNLFLEYKTLYELGSVYRDLQQQDRAMQYWHHSLTIAAQVEDFEYMYKNYLAMGTLSLESEDFEGARNNLSLGIEALEDSRDYISIKSAAGITEQLLIFHRLVSCCVAMGSLASALHFLEQSRRWAFLCRIGEKHLLRRCNAPGHLKDEYQTTLDKLHRLYDKSRRELHTNTLGTEFSSVKNAIHEYKNRLGELRTQLEILDPQWSLLFGRQYRFDPAALQKTLGDATVLVEFLTTTEGTFIFLVDARNLDVLLIPQLSTNAVEKMYSPFFKVEQFTKIWQQWCIENKRGATPKKRDLHEKLAKFPWKDLREAHEFRKEQADLVHEKLAQAFISELLPRLEDRCADRLVLIPQGILQLFPLHLLPMLEEGQQEVFLQDRYEIIYAPTSLLFMECNNREISNDNTLLLANYSGNNLPFLREEVRMIRHSWPGEIISRVGDNATPENICTDAGQASYLHCAVHTSLAFPDPLNSILLLSGGSGETSQLHIIDIISRMNLSNTEVITLSANERRISEVKFYGEFMGLAWAFLHAGVRTLVSMMWSVPDIAAFFIMEKFYHGLGQGLRPAMALQEAQYNLRHMTIAEMIQRLEQQKSFAGEDGVVWSQNIHRFLTHGKELSPKERNAALARIWAERNSAMDNMAQIPNIDIDDFFSDILPEDFILLDKEHCPFSHPYYWGAFYCCGAGLTENYEAITEESRSATVYVEELEEMSSFSSDDSVDFANIEDALSSLTSEVIEEDSLSFKEQEIPAIPAEGKKGKRIKARCPSCGEKIRCTLQIDGSKIRCPSCQEKIRIPGRTNPFDDVKIRAMCPHCTENIHCFLPMAGRRAKCPRCHKKVRIPKREILLAEIAAGDPDSRILLINE